MHLAAWGTQRCALVCSVLHLACCATAAAAIVVACWSALGAVSGLYSGHPLNPEIVFGNRDPVPSKETGRETVRPAALPFGASNVAK